MDIALLLGCGLVIIVAAVISFRRWSRERESYKFSAQLLEALELFARTLRAGHGIATALQLVANTKRGAVATEFMRAWQDQNSGMPLDQAFVAMCGRVKSMDLRLLAIAIGIHYQHGGNLADILDRVAATIRARQQLVEEVKTLTTEGRVSAWVAGLLPILMGVGFSLVNPGHLDPLWSTEPGHIMVAIAGFMIVVGMITIRFMAAFKP